MEAKAPALACNESRALKPDLPQIASQPVA